MRRHASVSDGILGGLDASATVLHAQYFLVWEALILLMSRTRVADEDWRSTTLKVMDKVALAVYEEGFQAM